MALGDDIMLVLPELRYQALSTMKDTGRISRAGGPAVFDPVTGDLTPAAATVVYEGPIRLRMPAAVEAERLFGEEQVTVTRFIAAVPFDVFGVRIDDVVTMLVTEDDDAADQSYKVILVPAGTDLVLKLFGVEAVE